MKGGMTRNQIRKRQYDLNKQAQTEAEILDKELEELEMQMANSRERASHGQE
jgi:DNA recombination-dependent growth factor C